MDIYSQRAKESAHLDFKALKTLDFKGFPHTPEAQHR
jgi:hypothetical protein